MKARGLKFTFLFLLAVAGFGAITMLLWNALLPSIFGIASINFWQALGILALSRILFGGLSAGAIGHLHHHHHNPTHPIHEKWTKMTPEERKQFINKRKHFGFGHHFGKGFFDTECLGGDENEEAGKGDE